MFCKNCGKQVLETLEFCDSCGESIQNNLDESEKQPNIKQSMEQVDAQEQYYISTNDKHIKKRIVPVIAIFLVVILLVGGFIYCYIQSTPKVVAENFYSAWRNKDSKKIFDNMYLPKSLTTKRKDAFISLIKNLDYSKVHVKVSETKPVGYKETIKKEIELDGKIITDFKVVFVTNTLYESHPYVLHYYMVKAGKRFFIFDKWVMICAI